MTEAVSPFALVLASDPGVARGRADALSAQGWRVAASADDCPVEPDIVVADFPARGGQTPNTRWLADRRQTGRGVVLLGGDGPADVRLPADATVREVLLACQLLHEILILRRQLQAEAIARRRLREESLTDPLTGLPNRRGWDEATREALGRPSAASPSQLCMAIVDLDFFKQVNDAHGHLAGDEVLRTVAQAVRSVLRASDFVARIGGDELGLLLDVRDSRAASAVLGRVCAAVPSSLEAAGLPVVTASAGYHVVRARPETGAPLLPGPGGPMEAADAALRQAKLQGRNRVTASRS